MILRPPRSTRTDTLFPYTTLFRAEYISGALLNWAERQDIRIEHIQPGKPQQNAYVERYNRTVRYAWLARTLFDTIEQVQDKATRWLWSYNHERPNMRSEEHTSELQSLMRISYAVFCLHKKKQK